MCRYLSIRLYIYPSVSIHFFPSSPLRTPSPYCPVPCLPLPLSLILSCASCLSDADTGIIWKSVWVMTCMHLIPSIGLFCSRPGPITANSKFGEHIDGKARMKDSYLLQLKSFVWSGQSWKVECRMGEVKNEQKKDTEVWAIAILRIKQKIEFPWSG